MADDSKRRTRSVGTNAQKVVEAAVAQEKLDEQREALKKALEEELKVDRQDRKDAIVALGYKLHDAHSSPADIPPNIHSSEKDGFDTPDTPPSRPPALPSTPPSVIEYPLTIKLESLRLETPVKPASLEAGVDHRVEASSRGPRVQDYFKGRTISYQGVETILRSLGLYDKFSERLASMGTNCDEMISEKKAGWHENFVKQADNLPPHPSFLDDWSDLASLATDTLKLQLGSKPGVRITGNKVLHKRKPDGLVSRITPATIEYGYENTVFFVEFCKTLLAPGADLIKNAKGQQLIEGILDLLTEQSSRGFAMGLGFFGQEGVLAAVDSETLRISRWQPWSFAGIKTTAALYRTLLCSSAYQLGLCPLFFDDRLGTTPTNYDPSSFGLSQSLLDPISLAYASSAPFHRRPSVHRILEEGAESKVVKIAQQVRLGQEANALSSVQHLLLNPDLPTSVPRLLSHHSFRRHNYQVNEATIDAEQLETSANPINRRHLEIIVTSTSSRGNLFHQSATKAQDLLDLFLSLICTVKSLWPEVVHRDISSNNVLKLVKGGYCLFDFDCSRVVDPKKVEIIDEKTIRTGTQDCMSLALLQAANYKPRKGRAEKYTLNQEFECISYLLYKFLTQKLEKAISTGNFGGPKSQHLVQKWLDDFARESWIEDSEQAKASRRAFWSTNTTGTSMILGLVRYGDLDNEDELCHFLSTGPTQGTTIGESACKALPGSIAESSAELKKEWAYIYATLGWDIYRADDIVIGARTQLWSRNPGHIFSRIRNIVECLGGAKSAGVLKFFDSLRNWGESIGIGGYDEREERGTEPDLQKSFDELRRIVEGVEAGEFLEAIWRVE